MIEIRSFRSNDLLSMFEVRRDAILNVAARDYTPDQIASWAGKSQNQDRQRERFTTSLTWVAVLDGKIVGYCNLGDDGHVDTMFVHSNFIRRGVATALLGTLEAAARTAGLARLYSEISVTARPFFEKHGFRVFDGKRVTFDDGSNYGFTMEKAM